MKSKVNKLISLLLDLTLQDSTIARIKELTNYVYNNHNSEEGKFLYSLIEELETYESFILQHQEELNEQQDSELTNSLLTLLEKFDRYWRYEDTINWLETIKQDKWETIESDIAFNNIIKQDTISRYHLNWLLTSKVDYMTKCASVVNYLDKAINNIIKDLVEGDN